ncbi:hypothetical protein CBS63078_2658 [Aspergillus niger]|uniref:Uncharacterized protein n=4 Tax=Aspergillus TaxID=5052 RepID=A0A3F3PYX7_9EURO|nr:uncharacterized protein BO96DRAFT_440662 [Aspergillus niger CBS 101883]XP_026625172.1 hypothetical protein BDQ94DRAFT_171408 [Aspergillus welwitschiae]KAI2822154.1 hypothetical protein CBS115989_2465 [Aspergillus niger]RDH25008.1 hypothetical protein M747DRAFT_50933 [Aspergillus niger ATCC 13496]RDK42091.1 hypothetical protein M752DRAFT_294065 [Aspergillus phoenicis ATCC 13157]KAI2830695.1 hypothetical protein CBS133816_3114 [Aspergillus niger]KAI2845603.1 hypothetical protein CBS11350_412
MSEHETQVPTPALSQPPQENGESLIDMLHLNNVTSHIVNAVGHITDAESDADTIDCDDHVLVFDNPFKGAMDGDDDEDL